MRGFLRHVISTARRSWVSGLVSAGTFVIAIGAFTDFVIDQLGTWQTAAVALAVTAFIVILAPPLESLSQFLRSLGKELSVEEVAGPVPLHRGLIVLSSIGQGIGSAEGAIRYHYQGSNREFLQPVLQHCWIITGGPASEQSATGLINKVVKDGFPADIFHLKALSAEDADNPEAVHRLVDEIYAEAADKFSLAEENVVADYTGGTKSMTSGMILACASPRRPLQFMKPRRYDEHGRADVVAGSDPGAIDIRFTLVPETAERKRKT